ncbi:unnamed protein product [Adineta steineri]|uniref:G-protein coupled receptors family 1 profile domain-containing protein n=1 Tax=Adineta steineri TaxID=433720 RepID=A0A815KZU2_9BILA|nr:unnamed protein product [Adineta steineri]
MLLCSVFGIICAITFISVVAFDRQSRTLTIMLAFNSAVAGLVINITCGCQAIYQLTGDSNDILCPFRGFLTHAATGLLYHTICVQTIHRLFVVVFPTRRHLRSVRVMVCILSFQWLVSITFGIPALILGRIVYQPGSHICQAALNDLTIFLYLATFIYFCPISIIIPIYIRIVHYIKQHSFPTNTQQGLIEQHRKHRELRVMRRLLIIVAVVLLMSFPYLIFFLHAQFFPYLKPIPYAQRISFISLSFGYGIWMLLNLIFTDKIRKYLINKIQVLVRCLQTTRIHPHNTIDHQTHTITAGETQRL